MADMPFAWKGRLLMQHQHDQECPVCEPDEQSARLREEGDRLITESKRLESEAERLEDLGKNLIEEANEHDRDNCEEKDLFIVVNRMRFDESKGVKREMSVDTIARLVGLTAECAIVRRLVGDCDATDPLEGIVKIKRGDQFIVTRKKVEGGRQDRLDKELSLLREGDQEVEIIGGYVLYRKVPAGNDGRQVTDVIVSIPNGYPTNMIDRAGLPEGSSLINQVKGSPQEVVHVGGRVWRMMSYHPHNGGGGEAWDIVRHGFHTYFGELVAWLGVLK